MPLDSDPVTTTVDALRAKQAAAEGNCRIDVGFWGGVVPENLDDLAPLARGGCAWASSASSADSGNPNFAHLTPESSGWRWHGSPTSDSVLLVHAESHHVIAGQPATCGRGYASFLDSRPDAAEEDAVALVLDTAAATGARAHVVHVSSAQVLPLLADARRSRRARHGRDLPALPDVRRGDDSRRRHRVRRVPAHPRHRQPRPAVGRACATARWT